MTDQDVIEKKKKMWATWFERACSDAGLKTQDAIAETLGFSRVQIQRWLAGTVRPSEKSIPLIAKGLNKMEEEIFNAAGYFTAVGHTGKDLDEDAILRIYRTVPSSLKSQTLDLLKAALRFAPCKCEDKAARMQLDPTTGDVYKSDGELINDEKTLLILSALIKSKITQHQINDEVLEDENA